MENKQLNINISLNITSTADIELLGQVLNKVNGVKEEGNSVKVSTGVEYTSYPENAISLAAPIPTTPIKSEPVQNTVPAVPTNAVNVTVDDLITAAKPLVNTVGIDALRQLLSKYGVVAINMLQPNQCNDFALDLRALGAAI